MENYKFRTKENGVGTSKLTDIELYLTNGGGMSEIGRAIVKFAGMCFMNAGAMASNGAAGHEIMGFK